MTIVPSQLMNGAHGAPPRRAHRLPLESASLALAFVAALALMAPSANAQTPGATDSIVMSQSLRPLGLAMQRDGSGTSWQPDVTPMRAFHTMIGGWSVMAHGVAFLQYDDQGSSRGDRQLGSVNWGMMEGGHAVGGGALDLRAMLSAEPFTVGSRGYPLLLQSGEAFHGEALHDRQHPHDLFMELAARYDHTMGRNWALSLYVAPVGEPAIGPVAFPHRQSAANDPWAPLGHHWQDATHVAFGVITAGMYTGTVKLEGSVFNGREPDDVRTNFDYKGRSLDSYAGRVTFDPDSSWSISASYAYLNSPEALEPSQSIHRLVGSASYSRPYGAAGNWASTFIYGVNRYSADRSLSSSALAETNLELNARNAIFGRAELVNKSAADLTVAFGDAQASTFEVAEITGGYVRELASSAAGSIGIGTAATVNFVPSALEPVYGSRAPVGGTIFLRLRPAVMNSGMSMSGKHAMPMTMMDSGHAPR